VKVYIESPSPKELRAFEAWAKERQGVVMGPVQVGPVELQSRNRIIGMLEEIDRDDLRPRDQISLDAAALQLTRLTTCMDATEAYYAEVASL